MKVKELMDFLKDINPEDDVITFDPDEGNFYTCSVERYKNCVCFMHDYSDNYERVDWPKPYEGKSSIVTWQSLADMAKD